MTPEKLRLLPFILYIGPDVLMPVASAIAAVVGFLLMFWRRTVTFFKGLFHKVVPPKASTDTPQEPPKAA